MLLAGIAALGGSGGCFSPMQPACAFSCVGGARRCPESYRCGDDGLCHRPGAAAACTLTAPGQVDAGLDAGSGGNDQRADGETPRDGAAATD